MDLSKPKPTQMQREREQEAARITRLLLSQYNARRQGRNQESSRIAKTIFGHTSPVHGK